MDVISKMSKDERHSDHVPFYTSDTALMPFWDGMISKQLDKQVPTRVNISHSVDRAM